jgi:hypothetical protein
MVSSFAGALDQLAADWRALTPSTETDLLYEEHTGVLPAEGTHGRRVFAWAITSSETPMQYGATTATQVDTVTATILLAPRLGARELVDALRAEAKALMDAANKRSVWPTGVEQVTALRADYPTSGEGAARTYSIQITIEIHTTEAM